MNLLVFFVFGIKWPRFFILCRCSFSHETKLSNFVVSTASLHPCFSSDLAEFTWQIWQYLSYLRYLLCVAYLWCCHLEIILGSPRHCGLNTCARRTVSCLWTPKGERILFMVMPAFLGSGQKPNRFEIDCMVFPLSDCQYTCPTLECNCTCAAELRQHFLGKRIYLLPM